MNHEKKINEQGSIEMNKKWFLCMGLVLIAYVFADPLDSLKPLLPDLPGWQAGPAEGFNSYHNHIKMINASRRYTQEDKFLNSVIFITNQASETGWLDSNLHFESAGSSITTETIDGFQVFRTHRKSRKEILIIVVIQREENEGAFLSLSFKNVSAEEALKLARQFNWNDMEFIISSMN